jgi:hypothetical protein
MILTRRLWFQCSWPGPGAAKYQAWGCLGMGWRLYVLVASPVHLPEGLEGRSNSRLALQWCQVHAVEQMVVFCIISVFAPQPSPGRPCMRLLVGTWCHWASDSCLVFCTASQAPDLLLVAVATINLLYGSVSAGALS